MTRDVNRRLERLQKRIEDSEDISSSDQTALQDFDNRLALLGSQYGKQRREKLLRHCVRISEEVGSLADALEDKRAAEDIVRWIHDTYDNEEYTPNEREDVVLELFQEGRSSDDPWGRVNPLFVREHTDLDKGQVEYALRNLKNAGWIRQLNRGGLYEFVEDPR